MSFVFYDTETTGTETWFDQILQFAAIRTDLEFNEIDRIELRCRLHPHVVPAPGAMRVTGVKASQLTDPALPSHYEMVRTIRSKLTEWSPSIIVGYNSIAFDEELLRLAFYMTLHVPYLTNTNGNTRSDVLRMVQACSLFAPDALAIPQGGNGQQVFKLDQVAPANGFAHDRAHDAMADVEATIHLCRLIADRAPEVWSSFMRFHKKASVVDFVTAEDIFCLSDFYFGRPYSWLVSVIGQNANNGNEWYCYDLSVDPASLSVLSDIQLAARLKKSPKPVRRMKANGVPMIFSADDAPGICKGLACGEDELRRRVELLQSDEALRQRLVTCIEGLKEEYPLSLHVEKQIYDGFFNEDEPLLDAFHAAPWPERLAIVESLKDERLKAIGKRLIYLEKPELLDDLLRHQHAVHGSHRLLGKGEEIGWLSLPKALTEISQMMGSCVDPELAFLKEHERFLLQRLEEASRLSA